MSPKNTTIAIVAFALALLAPFLGHSQCSSIVDLNTWSQEGVPSGGNWVVNGAGTSVNQTINGSPSYFVSPQSFINVRITGTFRVVGTDDDFVGFVFGHRSPIGSVGPNFNYDTYLFDWSKVPHASPNPGKYLTRINGPITAAQVGGYFWNHTSDPTFNVVSSVTGAGQGWQQNINYNFELTYLTDRIVIVVNNDTFFDVASCNEPGRFGFYNYSQGNVVYSNFSYQLLPNFSVVSNNVCMGDSAEFVYIADTCTNAAAAQTSVQSWNWDFGDGNSSNAINPNHLYATPGTYTVRLIITDFLGCQDSAFQTITVLPLPPTPFPSNNGPLCEGNALSLTALGGGGLNYTWTGPGAFSASTQNAGILSPTPANSGTYTVVASNGTCSSPSASTNVTVNPTPPTPNLSSNSPVCEDSTLFLVSTNVGGGSSYQWTGPNGFNVPQRTPTINNPTTAASGTYTVVATIAGCPSFPANLVVTVDPTPIIGIGGDTTICLGETTALSASGGATYVWNNSATTPSITVGPTTTTTYSVVGTSAAGCPAPPEAVSVDVFGLPTVGLGPDQTVCDSVVLDAGGGPVSYLWNTGATSQTITVNATGTYSVTVANGDSCIASDTVNITVGTTPTVSIAGNTAICLGDSTTLVGSGASTYLWSTSSTNSAITVSPNASTTYSLFGSDPLGCVSAPAIANVTVFGLPTVFLGQNRDVCDSTVLDAGTSGVTYIWNTGATSQTIPVTNSGTYSVTVTNSDGCDLADTVSININQTVLADLGPDVGLCPWDSAVLGTAPVNFVVYNWSTGSNNPTITVDTSGTFILEVLDANSCWSSDTITVTAWSQLAGNIGVDTLICGGDSLVIDASAYAGATYAWSPGGQTTPSITATTQNLYSVVVDDGNGCLYYDTLDLLVDIAPPLSVATSGDSSCQGNPVTITATPAGLANYDFVLNGNSAQSTGNEVWTTLGLSQGDSVIVTGTTAAGCPTNAVLASGVTILPRPTGIANSDTVCVGFPTTLTVNPNVGSSPSWTGSGGLMGSTDTVSYTYAAPGNYPWSVTLDNGSCDTTISGEAVVLLEPFAPTAPDDTACVGQDALLTASGNGIVEWFDDPAATSLTNTGNNLPLAAVTTSDTFWVRETITGCIGPVTQVILSVFQNPTADFMSSPDTSIRVDIPRSEVQFVNMSSGATSYFWDFGDGSTSTDPGPVHTFFDVGDFFVTLIASTREGCSDTISIGPYEVVERDEEFFVPSAFTPNGDGDNDVWIIDELFYFPNNKLAVFNRWGSTIFEVDGYQNDWDGTWNGEPLPEGTYYWFLDLGDDSEPRKGFVMIYR